jgi:heme-degrading monooxygenase HmoA
MTARYTYVWEFVVPEASRNEFEAHYAPNGPWGQMFREHAGYIETVLLKDRELPQRYMTIDRWVSREAYNAFRSAGSEAYEQLDRQCEGLASEERFLGAFSEPGT